MVLFYIFSYLIRVQTDENNQLSTKLYQKILKNILKYIVSLIIIINLADVIEIFYQS